MEPVLTLLLCLMCRGAVSGCADRGAGATRGTPAVATSR